MNKSNHLNKSLLMFLFLASFLGFSYSFNNYFATIFTRNTPSNVAGAYIDNSPLKIEIRTNSNSLSSKISSDISKNPHFSVLKSTFTKSYYKDAILVDLTSGNKVSQISELQNSLMLGTTKILPVNEQPSEADVLLIMTTK